jgi:NitT/TauT family transport system substrate-binding protein
VVVSYSNVVPDDLPVWVAKEAGLFEQHGLQVELKLIASSTGVPALLSGETAIFNGGGSEALSAVANGGDLVFVGNFVPVYPFQLIAPQSVTSIEQLRGLKVGVASVGSTSDIAARVGLRRVGLDPDRDVTIVAMGSAQNTLAGMLNGAIQANVSRPPDSLKLEANGFHAVFDLAELRLPSVNTCIVVQRSYLSAHREVVQRYVDSVVQGMARMRQDKPFAVQVLEQYYQSDDQAAMEEAYDYHVQKVFPILPTLQPAQFGDTVEQLSPRAPKLREVDLGRVIDNSLVQSAGDRGLTRVN